eukprot:jgi/Botrbrau1/9816/Bobra.0322s0020.1
MAIPTSTNGQGATDKKESLARARAASFEHILERTLAILKADPGDAAMAKDLEAVKAFLELSIPPEMEGAQESKAWKLADAPAVQAAFTAYMEKAGAGSEDDPICKWLYIWATSLKQAPAMQRFVARFAPILATKFLLLDRQSGGKHCVGLQACLIGIYKMENAKKLHFVVPDLATQSPYHIPDVAAVSSAAARPEGGTGRPCHARPRVFGHDPHPCRYAPALSRGGAGAAHHGFDSRLASRTGGCGSFFVLRALVVILPCRNRL